MQVYNLEIFSPDFTLRENGHTTVAMPEYVEDYLFPTETMIQAPNTINVAVGDYIRLTDDICGVVSNLDRQKSYETLIYFLPFTSLFGFDVMFDTDWQGQGTLEERIAQIITDALIENPDTLQNVSGLSVTTTSSTTGWEFNFKALTEGTHKLIVNMQETILKRALQEYFVAVHVAVDFQAKTIAASVGTVPTANELIESDLPNVIRKSITLDTREYAINKLILYDTDTLSKTITYYLHSDGTYDTNNTDRLTPVEFAIEATYNEDDDFKKSAESRAREVFGYEKIDNLIEIEVQPDDALVDVKAAKIGQEVTVISGGKRYTSIVTGKKLYHTATLIMGAVRLDLTNMIGG